MTKNRKPPPIKRKWSPGRQQRIDLTLTNFEVNNNSGKVYDPEEWFYTGAGKLDGTIIGAMEAGLQAYPF